MSGELDNSDPIEQDDATSVLECYVGSSKSQDLTKVSTELTVGEVVFALGRFIDFNIVNVETILTTAPVNAATLLMENARKKISLPEKWNPRLKMKNDILDWLAKTELGWEASVAKPVGSAFVNTLSDVLWYLDGSEKILADRSLGIPSPPFKA